MQTELEYLTELTSRILQDKNYLAGEDRQKRRQLFRPMEVDEPQYNKQVEHLRDLRLLTLELEEKMKNPYSEFGSVFAASGFKVRRWVFSGRPCGMKLDWALIKVHQSRLSWTIVRV